MRIIAGTAKGTKLYTLEGKNTRPTLDRVKESLFNILQNEIKDCYFLDLFSGSGAVGLEAASRGAKKVVLCEQSKEAVQIIKKNIQKTHLQEKVEIYVLDFIRFIQDKLHEKPDLIYIDPPYRSDFAVKAIREFLRTEKIKLTSIFIVETDREQEFIKQIDDLPIEIIDHRRYGRAHLIFLQKCQSDRKG